MIHQIRVRGWQGDQAGSSAVEFALVAPMLLALLFGIVCYGGYYWAAHSVQQLANDSARAAIAGLNPGERDALAQASLTASLAHYPAISPERTSVTVDHGGDLLAVRVAFDASDSFFYVFGNLIPMPPSTITRKAAIRLGGY